MAYGPSYSGVTWLVSELISEVQDDAQIPDDSDFSDVKILAFADQAIRSIMSEAQITNLGMAGRWLDYHDITATDGFRSGTQFLVPNAAASGTISHVDYYLNDTTRPYRLHPCTPPQAVDIEDRTGGEGPTHWYFQDGRVVLVPSTLSHAVDARVRLWFPRAHPKLVLTQTGSPYNVVTVTDVDTGANTIDVSQTSLTWPAAPIAVDIYSAYSPHTPLVSRLVITDVTSGVLTYTPPTVGEDDLDAAVLSSYKVALSGQSDCVQLPDSYRKALTSRVASAILRTIGDETRANAFLGVSREELASTSNQLSPRGKAGSPAVVNRFSPLRARGRFQKWRW